MNNDLVKTWNAISNAEKKNIFQHVAGVTGLPAAAVEKDWWVVRTLDVVFQTAIAPHTVFKGGTSLSKAWNLINRFSEDIDLALDRKFLGFDKEMNGTQVSKLRKRSHLYISEELFPSLRNAFEDAGYIGVELRLRPTKDTDTDPLNIEVNYAAVASDANAYLQPRVLIEIGSRSLIEPFSSRTLRSLVGENLSGAAFADELVTIPSVNPERTFLEKVFLLHEEFQQPTGKIKVDRLSRHLYDLEKLMDTEYATKALSNKTLYDHIVQHRKLFNHVRGITYDDHVYTKVNPVPPNAVREAWRKDYSLMQLSMIHTESLPFEALMERIIELKHRINTTQWVSTPT